VRRCHPSRRAAAAERGSRAVNATQLSLPAGGPPDLLVVDGGQPLPACLQKVIADHHLHVRRIPRCADACRPELLEDVSVVLVTPACASQVDRGSPEADPQTRARELERLLDSLSGLRTSAVIMAPQAPADPPGAGPRQVLVSYADPAATTPEELWGRLSTMLDYRPLIRRIDREVSNMERLGRRLNHHFTQLDQEMRLASRLQQEFLPRQLPEVGPARFAAIFRPASWVSGDIYDVVRLDETHVGFYVGDAVGHGVAAGLLTMFIKQSIWTKQISGREYRLIRPDRTLGNLNQNLIIQKLPNSHFVTACYCLLDTRTLELTFARGGHPYPLHLTRDGRLTELLVAGGLLGIFPEEHYPARTVQLAPGDKVILYSDGVEYGFGDERDRPKDACLPAGTARPRFQEEVLAAAGLSAPKMARYLTEILDSQTGSLNPQDDLTVIILEITE